MRKPTKAELEQMYTRASRDSDLHLRALSDQLASVACDSEARWKEGEGDYIYTLSMRLFGATKSYGGYVLVTYNGCFSSVRYLDDALADLDPDYIGHRDRYQLTLLGFKRERDVRCSKEQANA